VPGIIGILTRKPRNHAEVELRKMLKALRHEDFYVTGTWVDEPLGVYVGWVDRKGSFSETMPICDERGEVTLVFSGEEYSESGTFSYVKEGGHALETQALSYLLRSYEESSSFPARLNGRFHGLLTDRRHGTATLFNDRYGMQRIYYHASKDAFYFAAEAKAILNVRPELRKADPRGLGEFVSCGCVLENRTLFEGIQVLPPASTWVFRNGACEQKKTYFFPSDWENQETLDLQSYYQELQKVFTQAVPRYFGGTKRIGMSLTGGLDSRMIMAWHKPLPGSLPCYSFGGTYRDCQDVVLAREVARTCKQTHEVIEVGEEFLARFPHYAERSVYLTDGCAGAVHAADLYVNERARAIAPIRMTGNYGGEVLRRVRAFKPVEPLPGLFSRGLMPFVGQAKETYSRLIQGHPLSFAVFRQAPWHHYGLLALEQTQLGLRSPFLDNDFVRTVFRAPASACANNEISLRLIADGNPALMRIRTDRGLAGDRGVLATAVSRRLLDFTVKAEYAYGDGMPQWLAELDYLFAPLRLDRLFLGRHKFAHFRAWYRDVLSEYVREMLLDSKTMSRSHLERSRVEFVVNGHLKGNRNHTAAIHQLLTLELIYRLFLDAK